VEEVKVACKILEYMGLRERKFDLISCPSCGRAQVDVIALANEVAEGLKDIQAPLRVAVMGCIVNGPGEAREADLGVASGNGKGRIFIKGTVVETVPENRIVETLLRRASEMAEDMLTGLSDGAGANAGPVVVPVSPQLRIMGVEHDGLTHHR
jgi:(E)-4-hydroxy-3-methylbut-2-enyl-diphosphate synthase